ncbi:MAG TPA: hypothetical protein VGQ09_01750 [Chitinophagaceae bacterium]|nr:hypothetical protein [Chitinophagaceae bacterium]
MKCDAKPSFIQLKGESLKQLVTEVKETIAIVELSEPAKRSFGLVDMWNIRKNGKSATSLMRR